MVTTEDNGLYVVESGQLTVYKKSKPEDEDPGEEKMKSRRAAAKLGRAELRALTFLEARYGAFSAKMQTAGTLPVPSRYPPGTLRVPCTFRRGLIWKIRQKSGKIWAKSSKILTNVKTKNGAKECHRTGVRWYKYSSIAGKF